MGNTTYGGGEGGKGGNNGSGGGGGGSGGNSSASGGDGGSGSGCKIWNSDRREKIIPFGGVNYARNESNDASDRRYDESGGGFEEN